MPSSRSAIPPRTRAALRAAEAAGVEIAIATGRRHAYALPLIDPVGLDPAAVMISSNGAVVRRLNGELRRRSFLASASARKLCSHLREYGAICGGGYGTGYGTLVFTFDRQKPAPMATEELRRLSRSIERWVEANRPHLQEVRPIERAFERGEEPIQGMVCGTIEQVRGAQRHLMDAGMAGEVEMHRTEYAARDLSILDLLPPGCSKGAALEWVAGCKGIAREEVMAIGDNLNDLTMLEYAGEAVVMGNASPEMLTAADRGGWRIAPADEREGVAHVLEALLSQPVGLRPAAPAVEVAQ